MNAKQRRQQNQKEADAIAAFYDSGLAAADIGKCACGTLEACEGCGYCPEHCECRRPYIGEFSNQLSLPLGGGK